MNGNRRLGLLGVLVLLLCMGNFKMEAHATGARTYFGTEEGYEWNVGEISPMGFYLESEEGDLTEVTLNIKYDPEVLELKSENNPEITLVEEGSFTINQKGNLGSVYKKIVQFVPLVSDSTIVEIRQASGKIGETNVEAGAAASTKVTVPVEEGCSLKNIEINGTELKGFDASVQSYNLDVEYETEELPVNVTAHDGAEVKILNTHLDVGMNRVYIITTNEKGQNARYTLRVLRKEQVVEPEPVETETVEEIENTRQETIQQESVAEQVDEIAADDVDEIGNVELEKNTNKNTWKQILLKVGIVLVILLFLLEIVLFGLRIRERRKRRRIKQDKAEEFVFEYDLEESGETANKETEDTKVPPIVIRGENICMDFERAVNEYTSIKELAIQTVKGKRVKEKYRALNDVSFEIRKGEVIGVIGTNGAGKSTLLKIIAGAMYPTAGKVEADKSKIQILTLGTGFDMELTGKENVYLNGAIIGYEKEFIDQNYDKIVEFAELQEFMNEKVKNYSSGMISRLGFAIATAGEAAEILILDEVLSVGDRIFRQKSMKRIKEMIHGGSTVIMVSHSPQNISENCDRAIWLEKGHVIAIGDAKELCAEYEKYDGDLEKALKLREKLRE